MATTQFDNLPGLTDAERAYFTSQGKVDPTTGKPAEETPNDTGAAEQDAPDNTARPGAADETGAADAQPDPADADKSDDGDEEVIDVANAEGEPRRKMIAFGAYEKQRKAAKAAKEELSKTQQQIAYLTGLMQQRQSGQPATERATEQPAGAPDYAKEPQKWLEWVNTKLDSLAQREQAQQAKSQEQQQLDQVNTLAYQAEQDFVSGDEPHPDYYDALKFLEKSRRDELKMLGYDPATAQQIIEAQNKDIAIRALQKSENPAEKFYALSKARGFNAPKPKPVETEAQKIARQADNQKSNKSIAKLAGGASTDPLSLENLANMPTRELAKLIKEGKTTDILGIG